MASRGARHVGNDRNPAHALLHCALTGRLPITLPARLREPEEPHCRVSMAGLELLSAPNSTHQRATVGGVCLPISPITKQQGAVGRLSKHGQNENGFGNKGPPREKCL